MMPVIDKDNPANVKQFLALFKAGVNELFAEEGYDERQVLRGYCELAPGTPVLLGECLGVEIYFIDGLWVAAKQDPKQDWLCAGHDKVYDWQLPNSIYLDAHVGDKQLRYDLYHELIERFIMSRTGMTWEEAHFGYAVPWEHEWRLEEWELQEEMNGSVGF